MPLIVLLAAIAVAIASLVAGVFGSPRPQESPITVPNPASLPDSLVAQYAPLVYLHPGDVYRPMSPDRFIDESRLLWRGDRDQVADTPLTRIRLGYRCIYDARGCYRHAKYASYQLTRPYTDRPFRANPQNDEGFHLDLADSALRGEDLPSPVYYESLTRSDARISITYWLFYGFSRARLNTRIGDFPAVLPHEGDWERIEVILEPRSAPNGEVALAAEEVVLHQHSEDETVAWELLCKSTDAGDEDCSAAEGHPVIYSAKGSHASYAAVTRRPPCAGQKGLEQLGCSIALIDVTERGPKWLTWRPSPRKVQEEPWYGYGGAWGRAGSSGNTTGPLGPSYYKICPPLSQLTREVSGCVPPVGRTPFDDLLRPGGGI